MDYWIHFLLLKLNISPYPFSFRSHIIALVWSGSTGKYSVFSFFIGLWSGQYSASPESNILLPLMQQHTAGSYFTLLFMQTEPHPMCNFCVIIILCFIEYTHAYPPWGWGLGTKLMQYCSVSRLIFIVKVNIKMADAQNTLSSPLE